jgi:hypothetical protein
MDHNKCIDVIYETEELGAQAYRHSGVKAIEFLNEIGLKQRVTLEVIKQITHLPSHFTDQFVKDPWKHRSSGMRCASCMWCVEKQVPEGSKRIGRCRRHAPTMNGYPVIFMDDWCGDHKLDETKT